MVSIDRKVCRDILKLTRQYDSAILFDPDLEGYSLLDYVAPSKADVLSSVPVSEVPGSLRRLIDRGMIEKQQGISGGGMIFNITPELLHAKAFWWDRFTKCFWGGFVSGVAVGITANLLTGYDQSALAAAAQWLLSHI